MKTLHSVSEIHSLCSGARGPVVLVPTMGALHDGHCSLLKAARTLAGPEGSVVATIFVNPTQFGPREDLALYPRPFLKDEALCAQHGVDILFAPSPEEMYPPDFSTWVDEASVSVGLCGKTRPGHFRGVCTVVLKLFLICRPTHAIFGRKDFQQCAVISRMVRDLNVPISLHFEPTVREPDGLALSSRNAYLNSEERRQAPVLFEALQQAQKMAASGVRDSNAIEAALCESIARCPLARLDYASVVDGETLLPTSEISRGSVAALAVYFGKTRLIDNSVLL